jgi:HAD superfamily hydrolase (TIGR01490 family)
MTTTAIAALFDMDNTVLAIETGLSWTRFLYRRGELPARMAAKALYWSALYKLAVLDMEAVFGRLAADLAGDAEDELVAKTALWYARDVAMHVAPAARVAIEQHRRAGHVVALATGSTTYAARPVARGVGIDHVLASELEVAAGRFTGRVRAPCFGRHKVVIVEAWARDHDIALDRSYFYSDSYNDLPMLSRVGTAIAVNPDARLARHARRHGWSVARWI